MVIEVIEVVQACRRRNVVSQQCAFKLLRRLEIFGGTTVVRDRVVIKLYCIRASVLL